MKMSTERVPNNTESVEQKYLKKLLECHIFFTK